MGSNLVLHEHNPGHPTPRLPRAKSRDFTYRRRQGPAGRRAATRARQRRTPAAARPRAAPAHAAHDVTASSLTLPQPHPTEGELRLPRPLAPALTLRMRSSAPSRCFFRWREGRRELSPSPVPIGRRPGRGGCARTRVPAYPVRCPGAASDFASGGGVRAPQPPPTPPRCCCAGGACPERGRSSGRAGSRGGVTPSVRCGRFAMLPSPVRLRESPREASPRAPEGGGRPASLPAHRARPATYGP